MVKGDGDVMWPLVLSDAGRAGLKPIYEAGRVEADRFVVARWELCHRVAHVGFRPDRERLPEALVVVLRGAD